MILGAIQKIKIINKKVYMFQKLFNMANDPNLIVQNFRDKTSYCKPVQVKG